jgi:hypothetical protein
MHKNTIFTSLCLAGSKNLYSSELKLQLLYNKKINIELLFYFIVKYSLNRIIKRPIVVYVLHTMFYK